jgi:hypothetical protein
MLAIRSPAPPLSPEDILSTSFMMSTGHNLGFFVKLFIVEGTFMVKFIDGC